MNLAERKFWLDGKKLADVYGSKCALITVTVLEDEYVFQLYCLFCPNVFSCFENFVNHIKIKHPPLSFKNLKKETDNESDREQPDELVCSSLPFSEEFQEQIKIEYEYEEASNVSSSLKLEEKQSTDDAEFMSEDGEHSMQTLSSVDPCKIEEFNASKLSKGSPLKTEENIEKIVSPFRTSSQYEPIEESPQINLPKDSKFRHPNNEIKLEYEKTLHFTLNQDHLCNEVQENQTQDNAEFFSENDHSVESSQMTSPKDSKLYIDWRIGDPETRELTIDLIKMWKCYPCLWDTKCDDYTQTKRIEAWDAMRLSLKQKWNCEIQRDTLVRKIYFLRTQYHQVVRNMRRATTSKDITVPWFFKELSFLAPQTNNCEEFDRVSCSEDSFKRQKDAHDGLSRFVCKVCYKIFPSASVLKIHKKMHVGVGQLNRSNDDAEFISEDVEHSMETLESSRVTFPKKVDKVWRIGDLKTRELTLDVIKLWKSYPCLWDPNSDEYSKKKRLETWVAIRQSLKRKWNYKITKHLLLQKIRALRTQYDQGVRSRRKAKNPIDVRVPWFFKELSFLETHTYYCEECDRLFHLEDCFTYHKCTQDGILRYVCKVCNTEFASVGPLKMHNKKHHGVVDSFECKLCGRKFSVKFDLTLHLRWHKKGNFFACSKCDKLFQTQTELRNHMRSTTGKRKMCI